MDQDIQNRISGYLDAIESSASTASGFVADQAPLVAQEYLSLVFWQSAFGFGAACIGVLVAIAAAIIAYRTAGKLDDMDVNIPSTMVAVFGGMISIVFLIASANTMIEVTIAPRVVLLEKSAELLKEIKP